LANGGFLILLAFIAAMWFLLVRPQRAKQRQHAALLGGLKVGDEVITAGGIYGEVKSLDHERVRLEVDADVEIVVSRRAIASIVPPDEPSEPVFDEAEEVPDPEAEQPVEEDRAAR